MSEDLSKISHEFIGCTGSVGPVGVPGVRGVTNETWNYALHKKAQFLTEEELLKCNGDYSIYNTIIKKYNLESFSDQEIISILREETIKILNK
jgi:hypothetical protein